MEMLRITSDVGMTKTLVGVEKSLSEVGNPGPRIWAHSGPYQCMYSALLNFLSRERGIVVFYSTQHMAKISIT